MAWFWKACQSCSVQLQPTKLTNEKVSAWFLKQELAEFWVLKRVIAGTENEARANGYTDRLWLGQNPLHS